MYTNRKILPKETINNISSILEKYKIRWCIKFENNFDSKIYSVHLELSDFAGVGSNGKGVSREEALASGLAELMERIQSGIFFGNRYGIFDFDSNERRLTLDNLSDFNCADAEYKSIENNTPAHFNERKINLQCQSNGVASGNTLKEAIIQGSCELFERFAIGEIFNNSEKCNLIDRSAIKNADLSTRLQLFENNGFSVNVIDATLQNRLPVLMLLIIDKSHGNYRYSFGSAISFNGALERCITEIVQGISEDKLKTRTNSFSIEKELHNNSNYIYRSSDVLYEIDIDWIFKLEAIHKLPSVFKNTSSQEEEYQELLSIFKNIDSKFYYKDMSYLGFPTVRVYSPNFAELLYLTDKDFNKITKSKELIPYLVNLPKLNEDELKWLVEKLELLSKDSIFSGKKLLDGMFKVYSSQKVDLCEINIDYIIMTIYMQLENWIKALSAFNDFVDDHKMLKNNILFRTLKIYISSKLQNIPEEEIYDHCKLLVGSEANDYIYMIFSKRDFLNMIYYPSCPDCEICKYMSSCKKNEWLRIKKLIVSKKDNCII